MGRRKTAVNCEIKPWLTAKQDCKDGRFIQIGNSLFFSKAFQHLSYGSQTLYLTMALESGGRKDFIFPLKAATKYGFNSSSFRRYIDELEKSGFIIRTSLANLRKPNEYSFSSEWKSREPP